MTMASYRFWKSQPIMQHYSINEPVDGEVIKAIDPSSVSTEPVPLGKGFEWAEIDPSESGQLEELHTFLTANYDAHHIPTKDVDDEAFMGKKYSLAFLRWAWMSPGWTKRLHVGVRQGGTLVACIRAVPIHICVRNKKLRAASVDFACIHPALRGRRLMQLLLRELTRRCFLHGIYQALFTHRHVQGDLAKPTSTFRYFAKPISYSTHRWRPLDWRKLYDSGVVEIQDGQSEQDQISKYALPSEVLTPDFRPIRPQDIPAVHSLLCRYLATFDLALAPTEEESRHLLLPPDLPPDEQFLYTYVIQDADSCNITDFVSFHRMHQIIQKPRAGLPDDSEPTIQVIKAASLGYYASDTALENTRDVYRGKLMERLTFLVKNAMIAAKQNHFNAFNIMSHFDNTFLLNPLGFDFRGSYGFFPYFLYNYRISEVSGSGARHRTYGGQIKGGLGLLPLDLCS